MRRTITGVLCFMLSAAAQQVGQNAPAGSSGSTTFTTGTQLVVETVVVTDNKGAAVEGLKAKDFSVTEDGVPQPIRVFEHQKLPAEPGGQRAQPAPGDVRIYEKLGRSRIAPEAPGGTRYKDRRLLALYFDMTAMPQGDQLRALEAARKFIQSPMTGATLIAILRYAGGSVGMSANGQERTFILELRNSFSVPYSGLSRTSGERTARR